MVKTALPFTLKPSKGEFFDLLKKNRQKKFELYSGSSAIINKKTTMTGRKPNPYMLFLNENRAKFKKELQAQAPELKGKSLCMAICIYAGKIWKQMSQYERDQYLPLRYDDKYRVWLPQASTTDSKNGVYYDNVNRLGGVAGSTRMLEDVIWV